MSMDKVEEVTFKFEELRVYQKSLEFIDDVYEITKELPKEEKYGLTSQYRRAANSIALNIAEGPGDTDLQFNRFVNIAQGSIKEFVVCSTIATRQKFIDSETNKKSRYALSQLAKMLTNLQKHLKK